MGRRTTKRYFGKVTRWVWDGNVPLHEWCYKAIGLQSDEEKNIPPKEPATVTTWVFEAGTFVPTAKIQDGKQYSIVSDYMGTPIQMYDGQGNKTWDCVLDIYGKVLAVDKGTEFDCPFRFQGQYADEETGLYYNRFRYYDTNINHYLSQDPIKIQGGRRLYSYVHNTNIWLDPMGLTPCGEMGVTFKEWFDNYATSDLIKANKTSVEQALRGQRGMHEKFPVGIAWKAKELEFTYDELMEMTLIRDQVFFENVPDRFGNLHSGPHSTGGVLPEGVSSKASSWFHKNLMERLLNATSKDEALKIIEEHHNKYVKVHQH